MSEFTTHFMCYSDGSSVGWLVFRNTYSSQTSTDLEDRPSSQTSTLTSSTGRNLRAAAAPGLQRCWDRVSTDPAAGQRRQRQWQRRERYTQLTVWPIKSVSADMCERQRCARLSTPITVTSNQQFLSSLFSTWLVFSSTLCCPLL